LKSAQCHLAHAAWSLCPCSRKLNHDSSGKPAGQVAKRWVGCSSEISKHRKRFVGRILNGFIKGCFV
jgi:hypothetical protein